MSDTTPDLVGSQPDNLNNLDPNTFHVYDYKDPLADLYSTFIQTPNGVFYSSFAYAGFLKARFFDDPESAEIIRSATNVADLLRAFRGIKHVDFTLYRGQELKDLKLALQCKFLTNRDMSAKLLETGDRKLILNVKNRWLSSNHGRLLMSIRDHCRWNANFSYLPVVGMEYTQETPDTGSLDSITTPTAPRIIKKSLKRVLLDSNQATTNLAIPELDVGDVKKSEELEEVGAGGSENDKPKPKRRRKAVKKLDL